MRDVFTSNDDFGDANDSILGHFVDLGPLSFRVHWLETAPYFLWGVLGNTTSWLADPEETNEMIFPLDAVLERIAAGLECHVSDPGFGVQNHFPSLADLQGLFVVLSGAMMLISVRVMLTGTSVVLRGEHGRATAAAGSN